jgi:hypothetical protein
VWVPSSASGPTLDTGSSRKRVRAQGQQDRQPRADAVEDGDSFIGGADLNVHVAATGELLVCGQAIRLGHLLVPAVVDDPGLDRNWRGRQGRYLNPGPARCADRGCPAPSQLTAQLLQRMARLRSRFQLLLLQLQLQHFRGILPRGAGVRFAVRSGGGLQHSPGDRPGLPRPRFNQQELFFYADTTNAHRPTLPTNRVLSPAAGLSRPCCPITTAAT